MVCCFDSRYRKDRAGVLYMKNLITKTICIICVTAMLVLSVTGCAMNSGGEQADTAGEPREFDFENDPNISRQTKAEIRVACFLEEEYQYWTDELKYMSSELQSAGRISRYQARNYSTMEEAWDALAGAISMTTRGKAVFVPEYIFTYNDMTAEELDEMLGLEDIDLMLTFGSVCGKYLTANADRISYDYMVFGAANPIAGGIVRSETERYNDHSFAMTDSGETERALQVAYDIFGFKDIGVVYEDNEAAYIYSGIDVLEEMSEKYGFRIHREFVDEAADEADNDRHYRELKEAYDRLIPQIDTLLITTGTLEDYDRIPELLNDVIDAGIVTIAQDTEEQCRLGAMMHLMVTNAEDDGMFMAKTIGRYCDGVPITSLNMVYVAEPRLYLNYEVARRTGYRLPMSAYMSAQTIYTAEDMK